MAACGAYDLRGRRGRHRSGSWNDARARPPCEAFGVWPELEAGRFMAAPSCHGDTIRVLAIEMNWTSAALIGIRRKGARWQHVPWRTVARIARFCICPGGGCAVEFKWSLSRVRAGRTSAESSEEDCGGMKCRLDELSGMVAISVTLSVLHWKPAVRTVPCNL